MKKRSVIIPIFILGFFLSSALFAQTRKALQYREHPTDLGKNPRYYSGGIFVGALNYFGDLAPVNETGGTSLALTRPGLGISGSYRIRSFLSLRGSFMWGRIKGDDITADKLDEDGRFRYTRNLHFRNDIKELSFDLVFDLTGHHRTFAARNRFTPYIFAGVALFHHNPKAMVPEMDALHYDIFNPQPIQQNDPLYAGVSPGDWIPLKPLGTEGQYLEGSGLEPYSNWQLAVPVGLGVRFRVNRQSDLVLEFGFRQTFTDYLDDAGGVYADPDAFGEGSESNLIRLMADRSKEPVAAAMGEVRDLEYILENVHETSPYGQVPEAFGDRPYELIDGFGRYVSGNYRGKSALDIYTVTKLTYRYIFGARLAFKEGNGK